MSRIHEALKKAEEQRSASPRSQLDVLPSAESVPAPIAPSSTPQEGAVASAMPQLSPTSSGADVLTTRCVRTSWAPDLKTMLFFDSEEHKDGTEQFRTLRSRLYQMREKRPLRKILITSALPKEGKSFVAANLAQVMVRQHGRKALLIDADLRAARLHEALGTSSTPGIAEYLLGESDEFAVMQQGPMENLFFIPAGRGVSNPAELVANGRMKLLLSRLEPLFDWIIIDSPPAVPVSDASLLADYCDGVLMVVRSNATPFDIARKAREEFDHKHLIGVVLNGMDADSSRYNPYYYSAYGKTGAKPELQR